MNIFRIGGDLSHLVSFFFLLQTLYKGRSSIGISLKTQELYLLVFITRYLDLFTAWHSLYNTSMKIIYIGISALIVYGIRFVKPWSSTYEGSNDTFKRLFAILPCIALAVVFNESKGFSLAFHDPGKWLFEVMWSFSIFLEAVAVVPQLIMTQRYGQVENITSLYMASLGLYRALYVVNWVARWMIEPGYWSPIAWVCGVIQTIIYSDFLWEFYKCRVKHGMNNVVLPK